MFNFSFTCTKPSTLTHSPYADRYSGEYYYTNSEYRPEFFCCCLAAVRMERNYGRSLFCHDFLEKQQQQQKHFPENPQNIAGSLLSTL